MYKCYVNKINKFQVLRKEMPGVECLFFITTLCETDTSVNEEQVDVSRVPNHTSRDQPLGED